MLDVTEEDVDFVVPPRSRGPSDPILMDLDIARGSLAFEWRSNPLVLQARWLACSLFDQIILRNDIGQLFSLALPFDRNFFEFCNFLVQLGEAVGISTSVREPSNEGGANVFERLC